MEKYLAAFVRYAETYRLKIGPPSNLKKRRHVIKNTMQDTRKRIMHKKENTIRDIERSVGRIVKNGVRIIQIRLRGMVKNGVLYIQHILKHGMKDILKRGSNPCSKLAKNI